MKMQKYLGQMIGWTLIDFRKLIMFRDFVLNIQRFCLTITGEARLWYKSLRPINIDWIELQHSSRQPYSKIVNTREQLFHTWGSFHFDENTDTIDAYIHCIRQVTTLLGYKEPQILEVFKNYTSSKTILGSFPISWLMTGSRDIKENFNKREDTPTISRTVILHSIHKHMRGT